MLLILVLLTVSCSKDAPIDDSSNNNSPLVIEGETNNPSNVNSSNSSSFNSISERYSSINETTAYYKGQEYFVNYMSKDKLDSFDYFMDGINYRIFNRDLVYTDMNNDNLPDIFAFSTAFPNGDTYSYDTGRYFFLSDHLSSNNFISQPSQINFSGGRMFPNDFNNDGINEVLFNHHNGKMNWYNEQENIGGGVNFEIKKPRILSYTGIIQVNQVGIEMDSHAGASGDVNNDGLVDFIQFPIPGEYQGEWDYFEQTPQVSINTGDFNFNTFSLIPGFQYESWNATGYELFDVNGDNFLDVVVGWEIGAVREEGFVDHYSTQLKDAVVLWGNGTGTYTLSDMSTLEEISLSATDRHSAILGFGFSDYDNDNDIDIIITTTREEPGADFNSGVYYDSYYLLVFENIGGKSFVEAQVIEGNVDESRTSFTNFFKIMSIDFDNDGKSDLIPFGIANYGQNSNYISNLYWKKIENTYRRSW